MSMIPIEWQIKPFIVLILAVCMISLNIIYSKTNENIGNKREVVAFKWMLISYMVYCMEDIRLLIGDPFYTLFPKPITLFIVSIGFFSMSCSCYFWFMHVSANLHLSSREPRIAGIGIWAILTRVPLIIILLLLFTPLHVFVYELIDSMIEFKPMLLFVMLLDYVYLIAATAISIHYRRRAKTRHEKRKYSSQIIFILAFTLEGFLIGFLLNLPAIELCVIPVVLKIFVELQDSQIYTDALTKLFNRKRMTEFLNEEIATCSQENPLCVIMIDMDYFKSINDILGHDEGDKALMVFSEALREVLKGKNGFAARWGGDEFVVAGKDSALSDDFRERMQKALGKTNYLGFEPPFSLGIYSCTSSDMTCEQVMEKADADLYADKELRHSKYAGAFVRQLEDFKRGIK